MRKINLLIKEEQYEYLQNQHYNISKWIRAKIDEDMDKHKDN